MAPDLINAGIGDGDNPAGCRLLRLGTVVRHDAGRHIDVALLGAMTSRPPRPLRPAHPRQDGQASRVIALTDQTTKDGTPKLVASCTLEPTGGGCVQRIVTDPAVIGVHPEGSVLVETAPGEVE